MTTIHPPPSEDEDNPIEPMPFVKGEADPELGQVLTALVKVDAARQALKQAITGKRHARKARAAGHLRRALAVLEQEDEA